MTDWIRRHEHARVRVASTEVFEEVGILRSVDPATKTKGSGGQSAAEVLNHTLSNQREGAMGGPARIANARPAAPGGPTLKPSARPKLPPQI